MPFSDLAHMPMRDYVNRLSQTNSLWIFLHIPKTAGTSLSDEFAAHMAPYRNIFVDYEDRETPFVQKLSDAVDRFIADLRHKDFRSCSGHLTFDLVSRIQLARPDSQLVTFLRNPVDRVISDYRYQCSDLHPGSDEFRQTFPTIDTYVDSKVSQNKMSHLLYGTDNFPSAEDLVAHVNRRFAFVGLVEMYALSFSCMFEAMGRPGVAPQAHSRKTPDTVETKVAVTPDLREKIAALNGLDQAVYDSVHATLMAQREGWWKSAPKS